MASPWAQVKNQAQTAEPQDMSSVWASMQPDQAPPVQTPKTQAVWYTPDNGMEPKNKIDLHQNLPDVFPPPPEPRVVQDQDPLAQEQGHLTNKLNRDYAKDVPYDWSQHSLGGKIGHVMAKIGNVAGEALAPGVMARIPETELGRRVQEQQLAKQVQDITGAQSENAYRGSETAKNTAEEPFIAPKAQAGVRLQNAQAENLENPPDKWMNIPGEVTSTGQPVAMEGRTGKYQAGDISGLVPAKAPGAGRPDTPEQQYIDEYQKMHPGASVADAIKAFTNDTTKPAQMIGLTPLPSGGYLGQDVRGGSHVGPGFVTPTQFGQGNTKLESVKVFQPALDSAERMNVMTDAYEKAIKNHDQQAMLNLLANHLGMTMGLQKGSRITRDLYQEAAQSTPWLLKIGAKFDQDGYLSGVTLNPVQMRQMVDLARLRYSEDVQKARATSQYLGNTDDGPPRIPDRATINHYLGITSGDLQKAKALAAQDGWTVK